MVLDSSLKPVKVTVENNDDVDTDSGQAIIMSIILKGAEALACTAV